MRLKSNLMESIISNLKESDDHDKSNYMMLSRLKSDCDYYLGNGNRNPRNLWAGDEAKQIAKMRELYDKVSEEPEWLTKEDIDDYEDKMINGSEDSPENHIENPTVIEDKDKINESSLEDSRNNVIKELSSIIEEAGLTYEEVFEDIYTRAGENSELIDIILSNMLEDYKEYLGESINNVVKELSSIIEKAGLTYEEIFEDIYTRAGENSELIDIILSNMLEDYKEYLGEAAKIATKYNLKESSANDSSNIKKLEKYIKGSTLDDAAKFLGMYFHGDRDSFEVQGSELIDKKHKDNKIACSMDADKIASIANDLSNLKEDSYEDNIFTDIETALNQYGLDVTRYTEAGMMTKNIGWIVSNSEGEVNLTCAGTYLDESLTEEANQDLTESNESSPLKNVAEVIKRIITECNGEISYIDYYKDSISIKATFKADSISLYENDITLYGDLKFDNEKLIKSDLTTSSGPNVLNNDYIKCLNALYGYLVSGNSGYDL